MPDLRAPLRNLTRKAQRLLAAVRVADREVPLPPGPRVLLSCHDVDRSMQGDDGRYSPLLEGLRALLAELGLQAVHLSHPLAMADGGAVAGGAITVNRRLLRIRAAAAWRRPWRGAAAATAYRAAREQDFYAALLRRVAPLAVLSIQPPAALCRAARAARIPLAEAMHGTNVSLADPVFRAHMESADSDLPTTILAFDDVTHATLQTLCADRDITPLRAQDPWLHRLAWLRESGVAAGEPLPLAEYRQRVLFTTQWGYDGERDSLSGVIPGGILHPAVEDAFERAAALGVGILLRVHPIQMTAAGYGRHREHFEAIAARHPNVEMAASTRIALPLLLEHVDGHVTMSSSAVGEAAVAGVPSLLLCPTLHRGGAHDGLFRELEAGGMAVFGRLDGSAIARWMAQARAARPACEPFAPRHRRELDFYRDLLLRARPLDAAA